MCFKILFSWNQGEDEDIGWVCVCGGGGGGVCVLLQKSPEELGRGTGDFHTQ